MLLLLPRAAVCYPLHRPHPSDQDAATTESATLAQSLSSLEREAEPADALEHHHAQAYIGVLNRDDLREELYNAADPFRALMTDLAPRQVGESPTTDQAASVTPLSESEDVEQRRSLEERQSENGYRVARELLELGFVPNLLQGAPFPTSNLRQRHLTAAELKAERDSLQTTSPELEELPAKPTESEVTCDAWVDVVTANVGGRPRVDSAAHGERADVLFSCEQEADHAMPMAGFERVVSYTSDKMDGHDKRCRYPKTTRLGVRLNPSSHWRIAAGGEREVYSHEAWVKKKLPFTRAKRMQGDSEACSSQPLPPGEQLAAPATGVSAPDSAGSGLVQWGGRVFTHGEEGLAAERVQPPSLRFCTGDHDCAKVGEGAGKAVVTQTVTLSRPGCGELKIAVGCAQFPTTPADWSDPKDGVGMAAHQVLNKGAAASFLVGDLETSLLMGETKRFLETSLPDVTVTRTTEGSTTTVSKPPAVRGGDHRGQGSGARAAKQAVAVTTTTTTTVTDVDDPANVEQTFDILGSKASFVRGMRRADGSTSLTAGLVDRILSAGGAELREEATRKGPGSHLVVEGLYRVQGRRAGSGSEAEPPNVARPPRAAKTSAELAIELGGVRNRPLDSYLD